MVKFGDARLAQFAVLCSIRLENLTEIAVSTFRQLGPEHEKVGTSIHRLVADRIPVALVAVIAFHFVGDLHLDNPGLLLFGEGRKYLLVLLQEAVRDLLYIIAEDLLSSHDAWVLAL